MALSTKKCKNCGTKLYKEARFCHSCGQQTEEGLLACAHCRHFNPSDAQFCLQCGYPINVNYTPSDQVTQVYRLDLGRPRHLPFQLRDAFAGELSLSLEEEGEADKEMPYLNAFHEKLLPTPFFAEQMNKLAAHLQEVYEKGGKQAFLFIEMQVHAVFQRLLRLFRIQYVPELLPHALSPRILQYEGQKFQEMRLREFMLDYLQLHEQTEDTVYTNVLDIPVKALQNARRQFFAHQAGEMPLLFMDLSLSASGKEGFILTNKGLYWKLAFHDAQKTAFDSIENLKRKASHIEINGAYFSIEPALDYRLFKLLQHLKQLHYD